MTRKALRWLRNTLRAAASRGAVSRWSERPYDAPPQVLSDLRRSLERILSESILAFWQARALDERNGGYRINHDAQGNWTGEGRDRQFVTQARTLWFFARMLNSPYRAEGHVAAARHGFEFLRDRLWDEEHGGFFWEVDATGSKATKLDKHLYGQAFGLYALSEYAIATADTRAESLARELYGLMEKHAHDSVNGGYREFFRRDWGAAEPASATYMESRADIKQLNTHVHLLEALTRYHDLVREAPVRDRVIELISISSSAVVRKPAMACTDIHAIDWTPSAAHPLVTYGHDLENLWMLIEACESVGLPSAIFRELYEAMFHHSWKFGCDHRHGGFFYQGRVGEYAASRHKVWWVQAESLLCSLYLYRLTRREGYFQCFRDTLDWIVDHQIDWRVGEWHRRVELDGRVSSDKTGDRTGAWKCAYHHGRAVVRSLELIAAEQQRLAVASSDGAR